MQISVNIDVTNLDHVQALEEFTRKLGGHSTTPSITMSVASSSKFDTSTVTPAKEEVDPAKEARKKRAEARKAKAPEPVVEEEEIEEIEEIEEEDYDLTGEDDIEIDVAMLRELTSEKSTQFRKEIMAKFAEYGVRNVSTIPQEMYRDYYDFITSL